MLINFGLEFFLRRSKLIRPGNFLRAYSKRILVQARKDVKAHFTLYLLSLSLSLPLFSNKLLKFLIWIGEKSILVLKKFDRFKCQITAKKSVILYDTVQKPDLIFHEHLRDFKLRYYCLLRRRKISHNANSLHNRFLILLWCAPSSFSPSKAHNFGDLSNRSAANQPPSESISASILKNQLISNEKIF